MPAGGRRWAAVSAGLVAAIAVAASASERLPVGPLRPAQSIATLRSQLLAATGRSARTGDSDALRAPALALAMASPLDPNPFLVLGAAAEQSGQSAKAATLYTAAVRRDPHSLAAHYMSARERLAAGDADTAMRHMAAMVRLSPLDTEKVLPTLVSFARLPSSAGPLRQFVREEPELGGDLLRAMAPDPSMASRILEIAPPSSGSPPPGWLAPMAAALVSDHQPVRAARIWSALLRRQDPSRVPLIDGQFQEVSEVAPFGWTITPSDAVVAERSAEGIEAVTTANAAGAIVQQLSLAPPGRYRLSAAFEGDPALVEWRVGCSDPGKEANVLPGRGGTFDIAPDCRGTYIALWARGDSSGGSLTLRSVRLERQ